MPSYEELQQEDAWRDEYSPAALKALSSGLEAYWPGAKCYVRGDNDHTRGYHRSRRWIQESIYCTNRTYSVSRTPGDRGGGDPNWSCALDLTNLSQEDLHAACRRLDEACRAGRLEKITEWYGNTGGDSIVDGWDNISNRPASSDSSHLTHLHISFDRGRANEDHSDVLKILTGGGMESTEKVQYPTNAERTYGQGWTDGFNFRDWFIGAGELVPGAPEGAWPTLNSPAWILANLPALLRQIVVPPAAPIDIAALVAALTPVIRSIVREELDNTRLGQL